MQTRLTAPIIKKLYFEDFFPHSVRQYYWGMKLPVCCETGEWSTGTGKEGGGADQTTEYTDWQGVAAANFAVECKLLPNRARALYTTSVLYNTV
jgi:hypothetical protein